MRLRGLSLAAALAGVAFQAFFATSPALARPLTPAEQRYARWSADIPACEDGWVLSRIQSRFAERETAYWESGLQIASFSETKEIGFRSNGVDFIPRRYCSSKVATNDGKRREIYYNVGVDLGMTGTDWFSSSLQSLTLGLATSRSFSAAGSNFGVDWCVVGLDRQAAFGLNCKAARP